MFSERFHLRYERERTALHSSGSCSSSGMHQCGPLLWWVVCGCRAAENELSYVCSVFSDILCYPPESFLFSIPRWDYYYAHGGHSTVVHDTHLVCVVDRGKSLFIQKKDPPVVSTWKYPWHSDLWCLRRGEADVGEGLGLARTKPRIYVLSGTSRPHSKRQSFLEHIPGHRNGR